MAGDCDVDTTQRIVCGRSADGQKDGGGKYPMKKDKNSKASARRDILKDIQRKRRRQAT
ncbi:MAG: hypothetical protein WB392_09650 [Methanotrichaceae archaeon]